MKLKGCAWFVLILLVYTVILLVMSGAYNPRARLIPELLAASLIVLLVPLFLHESVPFLRRWLRFVQREGIVLAQSPAKPAASEKATDPKKENRRLIRLLAWFVGFTVILRFVSYLILVPVFLFLFIILEGKQKWWMALSVAVVMGIFDYLLFALFLSSTF